MNNAGKFLKKKSDFDISNDESDGEGSIQVANKTDTFVELKYKYRVNFFVNIEETIKFNSRESRAKVRLVLKVSSLLVKGNRLCFPREPTEVKEISRRPPTKGVGLRLVDSHTGKHSEDDFMPLETIRRPYSVIREKIPFELERETFEPERRLNPFAYAKLTTFVVMCKAYSCEPSLDLFRWFFNLCRAGKWLTFAKSVRVFPDPILFLAGLKPSWEHGQQRPTIMVGGKEMAFRNFIYTEDDDDLAFLPKEPSSGFGIGSPSASVNTKPPKDVKEPEVQPAEITADSGESSKAGVFVVQPGSVAARIKNRKCKIMGGSSRPLVNRKLASRSSSSRDVRAKTSASKDDTPFLSISDDDEATMAEFDQNHVVLALREKISSLTVDVKEHKDKARLEAIEASLRREVEELKKDKRDVVSKVVPYGAIELVHSDELGRLVGKLVSSAITYGLCKAYEQVAAMKEPFDLLKAKGYRSSYQKDHTQASNDLATATFPWLDEFIADATASIETLLSKKPPMLHKPAPLRNQMSVPSS
uniref:Transposase (Putative), gypsy type n=1 Tax=Tanacetum cinerariifolium TaxID=118510 RepID=A0A6L2LGT3_TANCI|nr:hypothetical protein [Tanacetum cinerariifolium]